MIIEAPESQFTIPESGEYTVSLASYEDLGEQPDTFNPGKMKRRLKLVWQFADGSTQWDWVTASIHPQATLYQIATYLLGENPPKKLNLDHLIGKRCRIITKQSKSEDGKTRSSVDTYLPATNARSQPVPPGPITDDDVPF